jgi:hypothetical protein
MDPQTTGTLDRPKPLGFVPIDKIYPSWVHYPSEFNGGLTTAVRQKLFAARIAIGHHNWPIEQRLIRLMVHVGSTFHHCGQNSSIVDPALLLLTGVGQCDKQGAAFCFLAWCMFGLKNRLVHLWHSDGTQGHYVTEIWYEQAWHLFDVHSDHQMVYRKRARIRDVQSQLMSIAELKQNLSLLLDEHNWFIGKNGEGKIGFYNHERTPDQFEENIQDRHSVVTDLSYIEK